jgi:hypothetical protein
MTNTNIYYPYNNFVNNPSAGHNQFVLRRYGRDYKPSNTFLPYVPMTFIKNNNFYYNPHTARGRVGQSSQTAVLNAVRRRV